MTRVLLHTCCGPCASYPVPALREEGFELVSYFYNPNIHPYTEWSKRREALKIYAQALDLKVIYDEKYNPVEFFQSISFRESNRCFICYQMRLEQAAHIAKKGRFDYYSSTLLVSKHQQHDMIRELGEAIGEKYGIPFLYRDFRVGFKETGEISREMGLYRQQYCGCLYSEVERYAPAEVRKLLK
jgi:predicted adenine nucleotide alpha hydrolase (AANH) superfamily ATPase